MWYADSAATVHVSPNCEDFSSYHQYVKKRIIRTFRNNVAEGIGEGDIIADVEYRGRHTRIQLTRVMHLPGADGKILSLKVLDQKGFESRIIGGCVQIMRNGMIYVEVLLGGELYEAKMKIIPPQESIMAEVKRDTPATDLSTWH